MAADLATHLTYTQMFTYNTYYATKLGGALWTLALEMQLYALFPLFARAFKRSPLITLAAMTGFSAGGPRLYCVALSGCQPVL